MEASQGLKTNDSASIPHIIFYVLPRKRCKKIIAQKQRFVIPFLAGFHLSSREKMIKNCPAFSGGAGWAVSGWAGGSALPG
jgi:hypothetical protein